MNKLGLVPITLGRDLFNTAEIKRIVNNSLNGMAKSIKIDFKVTTRTWGTKTVFLISEPGGWVRIIKTESDIYNFVSGGTRPHVIEARNAPMLVFKTGFTPKTKVKVIGSTAGRKFGATVKKKKVHHPGNKPRKFATTIALKWMKLALNIVNRAIQTELTKR